ncbi:MAG: DUF3972 domain-containing protein [Campylobacterota bacterium]|nr:DUF3972 domain-containing protein [Campylobacterota bacterium]
MSIEWMKIEDYSKLTGLDSSSIDDLIARNKLSVMVDDGQMYVDPLQGTNSVVTAEVKDLVETSEKITVGPQFIEKTIGTILNLHEKVLDAKDETIDSVKNENLFLKEALSSLQELYEEDRKTIDTLTEQLKLSQKEVDFMRRKYKLMWNKVADEYGNK